MKKLEKASWEEANKDGFILQGYTKANNHIIREITSKLGLQYAMAYVIILSHRNTVNNQCFPSNELLARQCAISVRTLSNFITQLNIYGYILINSGRQNVNSNYYFPKEDFYNNEGCMATRRKGKLK